MMEQRKMVVMRAVSGARKKHVDVESYVYILVVIITLIIGSILEVLI